MTRQVPIDARARAVETNGRVRVMTPDLAYQRLVLVNVAYVGPPDADHGAWVLVDAGVMGSTRRILAAVAERFGPGARPAAIVLTHGHFDHVGALRTLAERWDVPVYAHSRELPYLNGQSSYPRPDPTVGGGLMSRLAPLYPRGPIDVRPWLRPLPADGRIPVMPGWQWIHTPGHTPGHVSLWRPSDRTLIAGDAFITTRQESAYAVAFQRPELHGPPMYYTPDWEAAGDAVRRLAALKPERAITGHGRAVQGARFRAALRTLSQTFDRVAVPAHGRYVDRPPARPGGSYVSASPPDA